VTKQIDSSKLRRFFVFISIQSPPLQMIIHVPALDMRRRRASLSGSSAVGHDVMLAIAANKQRMEPTRKSCASWGQQLEGLRFLEGHPRRGGFLKYLRSVLDLFLSWFPPENEPA
jgi:hypothetical protein